MIDARLVHGSIEGIDEYVDDRLLERRTQIRQMIRDQLGSFIIRKDVEVVEYGGLQSAEGEIKTAGARSRKRVERRISFLCESVDGGATRVLEAEQLGHFVECFSGGVIERRS